MKQILFLLTVAIVITSCKKDEVKTMPATSLTLVNAVVGGSSVFLGKNRTEVYNSYYSQLALKTGDNHLYVWPITDSLHPYYVKANLSSQDREVYSLFVCGQPGNTDGVLIKENFPYHTDSTAGIRFINLSPNSPPLNITLSTTPAVNEVSNLAYKQFSDFKKYPAKASVAPYTFDIRRASDNAILYSYTLFSNWTFANETIVINGLVNGSPSLGIFEVYNDRW